ncbi:MAG: DUF2269 family protein [Chloroflexi bacterium]|nr:DUF2269 family protein [Chloroflexota bacterium]
MNSYKLLLFLHIIAVVIALGVTFVYPLLQGFAERQGVGATRFMLRFSRRLESMVVLPGAALVFLFGLGLIFNDQTGYKDDMPAWLTFAMTWYIAAVAVAVFVQRRNVGKALATLEGVPDTGTLPAEYTAVAKQLQIVGGLLGLSVVAIAFLMVWKPGE